MGFLSSLFGFDDAKPAQSQVVQAAKIPEELKPYVTEIMESAQTQFKDNMARGYVPYTGKTTADLTPEEVQSMERISGLAGIVDPYIGEAEDIYRTGAREFTGEEAQKLMSPYQQAVTDIELRKARENFEANVMPRFEAKAIREGGGPGGLGTRAGIEAAELQKGQAQLLADIQARGSEKAYQDAKGVFADQLTRERQLAGDLGRTGSALFQSGLAEAGALEGVGATKRGIAQNLLDESLFKFKEEEAFPQSELAKYSTTIYGNPVLSTPSFNRTTSESPYQPSTGQNLLGLGLTGLNIYGMGGGFGAPTPGQFSMANIYNPRRAASGGKVGGGLSDLPVVNRRMGSSVMDYEDALAMAKRYGNTPTENTNPYTLNKLKTLLGQRMEGAPQRALDMQQRDEAFNKALMKSEQDFIKSERKASEEQLKKRLERNRPTSLQIGTAIQQGINEFMSSDKPTISALIGGGTTAVTNINTIKENQRKLDNAIFSEMDAYDKDLRSRKQNNLIQNLKNNKKLQDKLALLPEKEFNQLLATLSTIGTIGKLEAEADKLLKGDPYKLLNYKLKLEKFGLDKKKYTIEQNTVFAKALADNLHIDDPQAFRELLVAVGIDNESILAALRDAQPQRSKTGPKNIGSVERKPEKKSTGKATVDPDHLEALEKIRNRRKNKG
tara:strand:+ start:979 stop:2985 length:2007 start_codon:yes stop_codon:yes gene_type:complete